MRARRLNADEVGIYHRLTKRGKINSTVMIAPEFLRVKYRVYGNFTIAELTDEESRTRGVGVAKRNATDRMNPTIGREVAISRAFQSI